MMLGYIKSCYSNGKDSLEDDEVLYIVCVSNFKRCMFEAIDLYRRSITKNMKRFKTCFHIQDSFSCLRFERFDLEIRQELV